MSCPSRDCRWPGGVACANLRTMDVPTNARAAASASAHGTGDAGDGPLPKVLVVDDHPGNRLAVEAVLETLGLNDNPFSEAGFKTLKYRPDFPDRFGCIEDARSHGVGFFA
jgi:hypothetical protein